MIWQRPLADNQIDQLWCRYSYKRLSEEALQPAPMVQHFWQLAACRSNTVFVIHRLNLSQSNR